ncbi:uncharacterized protein ARMOST_20490 [Armillaria ostoyae]|uniref:Uncharacterized protein n=1 Tax=Armillaria ostoyae TaxID=47428 RepID=A0A284S7H8_ARMOS|nr:uncharacterized protein ARMOST_20490 [Armillaria ostoyae]
MSADAPGMKLFSRFQLAAADEDNDLTVTTFCGVSRVSHLHFCPRITMLRSQIGSIRLVLAGLLLSLKKWTLSRPRSHNGPQYKYSQNGRIYAIVFWMCFVYLLIPDDWNIVLRLITTRILQDNRCVNEETLSIVLFRLLGSPMGHGCSSMSMRHQDVHPIPIFLLSVLCSSFERFSTLAAMFSSTIIFFGSPARTYHPARGNMSRLLFEISRRCDGSLSFEGHYYVSLDADPISLVDPKTPEMGRSS